MARCQEPCDLGLIMPLALHVVLKNGFAKSLQSCPTLCDPIDGSPPGSPVPGILQARVLEWGAIAFSRKMMVLSPIFQSVRGRGLAWGSRWSLAQCTYYYSDDLYV